VEEENISQTRSTSSIAVEDLDFYHPDPFIHCESEREHLFSLPYALTMIMVQLKMMLVMMMMMMMMMILGVVVVIMTTVIMITKMMVVVMMMVVVVTLKMMMLVMIMMPMMVIIFYLQMTFSKMTTSLPIQINLVSDVHI
jgi:hypothetical protein